MNKTQNDIDDELKRKDVTTLPVDFIKLSFFIVTGYGCLTELAALVSDNLDGRQEAVEISFDNNCDNETSTANWSICVCHGGFF